jgi:hypothetical protein
VTELPRFLKVTREGIGIFVGIDVPRGTYVSQLWVVNGIEWGSLFAILYRGSSGFLLEVDRRPGLDESTSVFDRFSIPGNEAAALRDMGTALRKLVRTAFPVPMFRAIPIRSNDGDAVIRALSLVPDHHFLTPSPIA